MFYDESLTIDACKEDPSLIFDLINEDHKEFVDKIIEKKIVNINVVNEEGNDILYTMLKTGWYDLVLKHMKNKSWDPNHQNKDGDTFAHLLVMTKYLDVLDIIKVLLKNPKFMPNIRNKKGETILDKSINNNYIYTTVKILEDERFNNIDLVSFKNLYEKYIKSNEYGSYSKLNNLDTIIQNLALKDLLPKLEELIKEILENFKIIKTEVEHNETKSLDTMIYSVLEENTI